MTDTPRRTIVAHDLYSAHLGEERTVKIYLPPGASVNHPLPVLYCHDGNEFFTHGRIATLAHERITDGRLPPFAIVGVAVNHPQRTNDYSMAGERHVRYMRFIAQECLPFVERIHPELGRSRELRCMAGVSLGAVASMSALLAYPELFDRAVLLSGAFLSQVRERISRLPELPGRRLYMRVGLDEACAKTPAGTHDFLGANRLARDLFAARGAEVDYAERAGSHIWGFWQSELPAALAWFTGQ